jgi:hypothetical protein
MLHLYINKATGKAIAVQYPSLYQWFDSEYMERCYDWKTLEQTQKRVDELNETKSVGYKRFIAVDNGPCTNPGNECDYAQYDIIDTEYDIKTDKFING